MKYYHVSTQLHEGYQIIPSQKSFLGWSRYAENAKVLEENEFIEVFNYLKASDVEIKTGRRPQKWLCEILFENIRKQYYSNRPSRIYGTYLCKDLDEAMQFNQLYRKGKASIFEVDIDENVVFFDMNIFTRAETSLDSISDNTFASCVNLAHYYWSSAGEESITQKEYIYDQPIIIGKKIL